MSKLLSLLPPPKAFEEARAFTDSRFPDDPEVLAFRIVPGALHESALQDKTDELKGRFVVRQEPISLPGLPPQAISASMCQALAALMVCQCPPKADAITSGGMTQDLTGMGWRPRTLDSWVALANASEEVFWSAVALVRCLEARSEGIKTRREYVSIAYQQEIPIGLSPKDFVTPSLEGLTEEGTKIEEEPGNE